MATTWIGTPGWEWNYGDIADHYDWDTGVRMFKRARLTYPSRFAAFWDDPADYHIVKRKSPTLTHHGSPDAHAMTFLDGHAKIVMTLTSPNCPVAESLPAEVEQKVRKVPGIEAVDLQLTWDPPWGMEKLSEAARLTLGMV